MRTLEINEELLKKAMELGLHAHREEAVNAALQEYVKFREQQKILRIFSSLTADDHSLS